MSFKNRDLTLRILFKLILAFSCFSLFYFSILQLYYWNFCLKIFIFSKNFLFLFYFLQFYYQLFFQNPLLVPIVHKSYTASYFFKFLIFILWEIYQYINCLNFLRFSLHLFGVNCLYFHVLRLRPALWHIWCPLWSKSLTVLQNGFISARFSEVRWLSRALRPRRSNNLNISLSFISNSIHLNFFGFLFYFHFSLLQTFR